MKHLRFAATLVVCLFAVSLAAQVATPQPSPGQPRSRFVPRSQGDASKVPPSGKRSVAPLEAPAVEKAFSGPVVAPAITVGMTITLTNPNAQDITGVAFTDAYPTGLVNATGQTSSNTCGGALVAPEGGASLSLSGGTIPAAGTCTVTVTVGTTVWAVLTNTIPAGAVTSDNAAPNASAASAEINTPVGPPPTTYPAPITSYLGQYVNSARTASHQYEGRQRPRTYRADLVKAVPELDMLYMIVGSTFVGQKLSTFADRVRTAPRATISRPITFGETYLPFEKWEDAERSGWELNFQDVQQMLYDFDLDDRGYIHLAYSTFGFGTINQDFRLQGQVLSPGLLPRRIVQFRSGNSYYVLLSDTTAPTAPVLYDVTIPSAPLFVRAYPGTPGFRDSAKTKNGRIALVMANGQLRIHTPATLLGDQAPIYTSPGAAFRNVTTDGTNFWALGRGGRDIHLIQPAGGTLYTETITPSFNGLANDVIDYGEGYLTVSGITAHRRVAIYRVDRTALTLLSDGQYFHDRLTAPFVSYGLPTTVLPVFDGKETLLVAATFGLGEVFTLPPRPSPPRRSGGQ